MHIPKSQRCTYDSRSCDLTKHKSANATARSCDWQLTDLPPHRPLVAEAGAAPRKVDVVAQIVIEIKQRSRMARVEDRSEIRVIGERIDQQLAELVVEDHPLLHRRLFQILPVIDGDEIYEGHLSVHIECYMLTLLTFIHSVVFFCVRALDLTRVPGICGREFNTFPD